MARIKNVEAFCSICNTVTKMELAGEVSGSEPENKRWAKCKKCKQTMIINVAEDIKVSKPSWKELKMKIARYILLQNHFPWENPFIMKTGMISGK